MSVYKPTIRVRAALLAALAVCSACGGGGGSGGGGDGTGVVTPPPAPPVGPPVGPPSPPAVVVTARAVASAASVQEGQPFTLDASTSSEAGGATLTYTWTQISGPAVAIAAPSSAVLNLNAAEVSADTKAEFRVTAASGAVSSVATVEVTFTNIAQTPVFMNLDLAANALLNATYPAAIATIVGNWTFGLVGTTPAGGGPITFTQFQTTGSTSVQVSPVSPFAGTFSQPATFFLSQTRVGGTNPFDFERPWLTVTEETANRYRVFEKTAGGSFGAPIQDISMDRPCTTEVTYAGPPSAITMNTYVGQRGHGFTIVSQGGTILQQVNTGQSFCVLAAVRAPISANGGGLAGPTPDFPDLLAVDTVANTIAHFSASGTPAQYTLKSQAPVRLSSTTGALKFVAATKIWAKDAYGEWLPVSGLALVYSDGRHQGEHRLVMAGLDSGRVIRQETHTWTLGVPSDVILDDLDNDRYPEVIILSSTSPQAMVYEMNDRFVPAIPNDIAATPSFIEIGLGATKALPTMSNILSLEGLVVAYRDKSEVKLFYSPD